MSFNQVIKVSNKMTRKCGDCNALQLEADRHRDSRSPF